MNQTQSRAATLGREFAAASVRAHENLASEGALRNASVRRAQPHGERVRSLLTRTGVDPQHVTWLSDQLEMIARQTLKRENVGVRRQGPDFVVDEAGIIAFCKGVGRFVRSNPPRRVEVDPTIVRPDGVAPHVERRPRRAMTVVASRAHTQRTAPMPVTTPQPIPEAVRVTAPARDVVAAPPPRAVEIDAKLRAEVQQQEELRRNMDVEPGYQYGFF